MQAATHTLHKSPKVKKIEDIVKPDATMRLHQRLFDRRRKHHIDVKEETGPGTSLSAYLISPEYRQEQDHAQQTVEDTLTTSPVPVLQYSQITRDLPEAEGNYLENGPSKARSFSNRITQRYHVFMSQHKPFYYSLANGMASGWLQNPRARVALAGSALALLLFFTGTPFVPPKGPDNPTGQNPIVIQDTSKGTPASTTTQLDEVKQGGTQNQPSQPTAAQTSAQQPASPVNQIQDMTTTPALVPANGGGYGSGPTSSATPSGSTSTNTSTPTASPTNLIQDVVKPTPITIPGQNVQLDDKKILETTDTTITIN